MFLSEEALNDSRKRNNWNEVNQEIDRIFNEAVLTKKPKRLQEVSRHIKNLKDMGSITMMSKQGKHDIEKIEQLLAEQFNVVKFTVSIRDSTFFGANAFTYGIETITNFPGAVTFDDIEGFRFKKKGLRRIAVNITTQLIHALEPDEIVAIILHEIGHNFYCGSITNRLLIFYMIFEIIRNIGKFSYLNINQVIMQIQRKLTELDFLTNGFLQSLIDKLYKTFDVKKKDSSNQFFTTLDKINIDLMPFVMLINRIQFITNIPRAISFLSRLNPLSVLIPNIGGQYDNEEFADSFATAQGYSVELSESLTKLHAMMSTGKDYKTATENHALMLSSIPLSMFMAIQADVHPTLMVRIDNQIDIIKSEIKNCEDKQIQKDLKKTLDKLMQVRKQAKVVEYNNAGFLSTPVNYIQKGLSKIKYIIGGSTYKDLQN